MSISVKNRLVPPLLLIIFSGNVAADNPVNVSLSAAIQPSTWKGENLNGGTDFEATGTQTQLAVNIRKGSFYGGLAFQGGEFEFEGGAPNKVGKTIVIQDDDATIRRGEFDLVFGYYFVPQFSVFIDFKTIENNWKDDSYTLRYKGAGFGVNGYVPVDQDWFLIGSIGFMNLDIKADGESIGDGSGGSLSFGALYRINPKASLSIRLKSQHNEFEFDQGSKQEHDIGSLVLGFSYSL